MSEPDADRFRSIIEILGVDIDDIDDAIAALDEHPDIEAVTQKGSPQDLRLSVVHQGDKRSVASGKMLGALRVELNELDITYSQVTNVITGSPDEIRPIDEAD
jgi:hypothetical protein